MSVSAYFTLLTNRINDMRNPDFISASASSDPRFKRFAELSTELDRAGMIQWVADPRKEISFNILITDYAPAHSEKVREYLSVLEFPMPVNESADIVIPVYFGIKGRGIEGVAISTRSTLDLIEILRSTIAIPAEHMNAGMAIDYPTPGPAGEGIRIHATQDKPARAAVAVKHRGYWFYIDDADVRTKLFYTLVRTLWSVSIAAGSDQSAAPVLTVPVSR
jgi:hypothetical protein